MNTYLIPTTPDYQYEPYNYIYMVNANSPQEAYNTAKQNLDSCVPKELSEYECYPEKLINIPKYPFHESQKYDILFSLKARM